MEHSTFAVDDFEVRVSKDVIKEAKKKLPEAHRRKLTEFIRILRHNPVPVPEFDVRPVKGRRRKSDGRRYRLRLGNYRVFYDVYWKEKAIVVLKIEPRERAYSR